MILVHITSLSLISRPLPPSLHRRRCRVFWYFQPAGIYHFPIKAPTSRTSRGCPDSSLHGAGGSQLTSDNNPRPIINPSLVPTYLRLGRSRSHFTREPQLLFIFCCQSYLYFICPVIFLGCVFRSEQAGASWDGGDFSSSQDKMWPDAYMTS